MTHIKHKIFFSLFILSSVFFSSCIKNNTSTAASGTSTNRSVALDKSSVNESQIIINTICLNAHRDFSVSGIRLLESYKKLIANKPVCTQNVNGIFYGVTSTMPANEYLAFEDTLYKNQKVSFASTFNNLDKDSIRNIWDFIAGAFTYYGACAPDTIIFPYPRDGSHSDDVFICEFVPVESFKKTILNPIWNQNNLISGVNIFDMQTIVACYLETPKGYISKNYPEEYYNKSSPLGIVCLIRLKSGRIVPCYIIDNEMQGKPIQLVLWKK